MPNVLDLHIILQKPYPDILKEVERLLWERNGKPGKPIQYKAEAVRYALNLANKDLKEEKLARDLMNKQQIEAKDLTAA